MTPQPRPRLAVRLGGVERGVTEVEHDPQRRKASTSSTTKQREYSPPHHLEAEPELLRDDRPPRPRRRAAHCPFNPAGIRFPRPRANRPSSRRRTFEGTLIAATAAVNVRVPTWASSLAVAASLSVVAVACAVDGGATSAVDAAASAGEAGAPDGADGSAVRDAAVVSPDGSDAGDAPEPRDARQCPEGGMEALACECSLGATLCPPRYRAPPGPITTSCDTWEEFDHPDCGLVVSSHGSSLGYHDCAYERSTGELVGVRYSTDVSGCFAGRLPDCSPSRCRVACPTLYPLDGPLKCEEDGGSWPFLDDAGD